MSAQSTDRNSSNPFSILSEPWDHAEYMTDHCFELLRQSAVCHADASLTTFLWHPAKERPMFNATESFHTCVDWSSLIDSLADRVIPNDELLRLNNPLTQKMSHTNLTLPPEPNM